MSKKNNLFLALLSTPCLAQQSAPGSNGVIAGTLTADNGAPVAGAYVTLQPIPPYAKTRQNLSPTVVSDASGSFRFAGLYEINYQLCVQSPGRAWLNPCEWGLQPTTVSVSAAESTANVSIVLKTGAAVSIRVNDPGGLLTANEGRTPGAHLLIGANNDALAFRQASMVSQDSGGRLYQMVVPFGTPHQIIAYSGFFQLSNASGTPLARTVLNIPATVPLGQTPPTITMNVTGGGH